MKRGFGRWAVAGATALAGTCWLMPEPGIAAQPKQDRALQEALLGHIRILASDAFAGREPGTAGEAESLRYIARQMFEMGLVSGTNQPANPWFAPVRLVAREPVGSVAQFARRGRLVGLAADEALVLTSGRRALVQGAPVLFVGFGQKVPPRAELAGRVALMLDSGAGLGEAPYGPASQARQNALLAGGAAAVVTVLDGQRTLGGVSQRRKRSGYALASEALGGDIEAFVSSLGATQLLAGGGETLAGLQREAARGDFVPRLLDLTASLEATTRETSILTHNIIGKIPARGGGRNQARDLARNLARDQGREAVVLMAHWDHFGTCASPPAEHVLCNGAVDNASGVAAMLEVARRLVRVPMERDVYVVATTAEELGLLGAEAFAENPPLPLKKIVAAFNLDSVAIAPAGTPLGLVGRGMTALDTGIAAVAREQKRKLLASDAPNQYIRRQDGWALMAHDLPAVMVTSAYGDLARLERFFETDYHRPADVVKPELELGGAAEDVAFHVALVQYFADPLRYAGPVSAVVR